ncbi:MAG: hypothetical protein ACPLXP_01260 [Microgenomates group bacterium]
METFLDYSSGGGKLFAITGDVDNLGIYVARNGRPAAENLVDLYNQIIRNYLEMWAAENQQKIRSLSFVPSGEEVFIIGVTTDEDTAQNLFDKLRGGVMELMQNQHYIDLGETSVSFGGKVFGNELDLKIKTLADAIRAGKNDEEVFPIYLEVMSQIRRETAIELDRQKFKDILNGNYPVEVRQLVLARMLLFKRTTRVIVESLNRLPKEDVESLLALLGDIYGVEPGKEDEIDNFLNGKIRNQK